MKKAGGNQRKAVVSGQLSSQTSRLGRPHGKIDPPTPAHAVTKTAAEAWSGKYLPLAISIETDSSKVAGTWKEGESVQYVYFKRAIDNGPKAHSAMVDEDKDEDDEDQSQKLEGSDQEDEMEDIKRRSLNVVGAPVYFTNDNVEQCFSIFGNVDTVFTTSVKRTSPGGAGVCRVYCVTACEMSLTCSCVLIWRSLQPFGEVTASRW